MSNNPALSSDSMSLHRDHIQRAILDNIELFGPKNHLRDACEYALSSGGKRFRPCLTLMMADALGFGADATFSALGVEFFHTASLVADDLPSMDDDDFRRNQPSVHKKFGESVALLVSYALIAAGYDCIAKNAEVVRCSGLAFSDQSDRLGMLALENATFNTGLMGATGGQFLDIATQDFSLDAIRQIIQMKTSSLFEISFVFGWLFGGGSPEKLSTVKEAASHFGMAFQIADDLIDQEQDRKNPRSTNIANRFGEEEARQMFHEEHKSFLLSISGLGVSDLPFRSLIS